MTSWVGRINDIRPVLDSLFKQTYKDFKLWLTLSSEEFNNRPLPDFLNNINDKRLIINWVGPNLKTMKKVFPVLPSLQDNDIIITVDDDVIYDEHFVETRLKDFNSTNQEFPISTNRDAYQYSIKSFFSSCGSVFTKKMLEGYEVFVNREILETYDDDWAYTFVILLNGYRFRMCSEYYMEDYNFINQDTSSKDKVYVWQQMIPVFQYRIVNFVGMDDFKEYIGKIRANTVKADWDEFKQKDKNPSYIF